MLKPLGAAVIGVGIYGRCHVRAYRHHPDTELVAVWSRTEGRARAVAEEAGCDWTTDLDGITSDPRIRLVSVATPDFAHTVPAIKMLESGKHVLLEKPMAYTAAEARQMIAAARLSGVQLMVNFHNRYYPSIASARRMIAAGRIGKPVLAFLRLSDRIEVATRWLPWAGRSGPEWFLLPHTVDLARFLLGQEVRRVSAVGRKGVLAAQGTDCYDFVQAQLALDDGVATLESSWILPEGWRNVIQMDIDIQGTEGTLEIAADDEGLTLTTGKGLETPLFLDPTTTEWLPIKAFIESIRDDLPVPVPGEEGLACTAVLEAIARSLQTGQPAEVEAT
jgi:predicted dehydrogenase